jgi:hypothetical protein
MTLSTSKPIVFCSPDEARRYTVNSVYENLTIVLRCMFQRSLLWMFLRTVPENILNDETFQVIQSGLYKELTASQIPFSLDPIFNWSSFRRIKPMDMDPFAHRRLKGIAYSFHIRLQRCGVLFPHVNRTKNTSMETAQMYELYSGVSKPYTRTVDLEIFYGETGIEIPGNCELRKGWKFNDLKPRLYYAQGGKDYFRSRYLKKFAVLLMESIPTTTVNVRTKPSNYLNVENSDFITTWDFTSFTTTLSELKFFLEGIIDGLETFNPDDVELFDYHKGRVMISPIQLLAEYNESVNLLSRFSAHRLSNFLFHDEMPLELAQQNSGMLGVAGNIGFSTALHGAIVHSLTNDYNGVCVGDDGLAITPIEPSEALIPTLTMLGNIHPEKFTGLQPNIQGPMLFLKRGLYRYPNQGLVFDTMLNFPISVYVDHVFGHREPAKHMDTKDYNIKVAGQVHAFLWEILSYGEFITDNQMDLALIFLRDVYKRMCWPYSGTLSFRIKNEDSSMTHSVVVPSLRFQDIDYRMGDWLEYLFDLYPWQTIRLPILIPDDGRRPLLFPGQSIMTCRNKIWNAMQDLGLVQVKDVMEDVEFLTESNRRRLKVLFGRVKEPGLIPMVEVECLKEIPEKFEYLFHECGPQPSNIVGRNALLREWSS